MPMNQGVIPQGARTFSRDLTKPSPCSAGILPGLCIWLMEKSISPLFPGPRGDVVANGWCIMTEGNLY